MSSDKLVVNAAALLPTAPVQRNATTAKANSLVQAPAQAPQPEAKAEPADLGRLATRIENYLKSVNRALEFKVDTASGRTVVTVRDAENGELIRQIPNEEVLRFAQLVEEQTVVLLNEKV